MTTYQNLLASTHIEREALLSNPLINRGATGNITLEEYIKFLTQAYHHVKHTVPLLMRCGSRLPESYEWLREKVAEYIEEELGHQEWILNDIKASGGDAESVRNGTPSIPTELMVAYAYDVIDRVNPVGFFGMVLVLEGTSVAVASKAGEAIRASLNLPAKSFSYLMSHGSLDVGHTQFYEDIVNSISDERDVSQLIRSAKIFYKLYADIFTEIEG